MKKLEDLNLRLLSVEYAREVGTDDIVFANVRFKTSTLKATVEIETDSYLDTETILDEIEGALIVSLKSDYFEFKGFKNGRGVFVLEELNDVVMEDDTNGDVSVVELAVRKALLNSLDKYEDEISEMYSYTCSECECEYKEDNKSLVELIEEAKVRFKDVNIKKELEYYTRELNSIESFLEPLGIRFV